MDHSGIARLRHRHAGILDELRTDKKLSDDNAERLAKAIDDFKAGFTAADGSSVVVTEEPADAMEQTKVGQEKIKANKPAPKK